MTTDASKFERDQAEAWSSVAPAWNEWWPLLEGAAQHLNERLVDLAGVEPGQRVLDVACGLGEPALTAARRVGSGGHVLALDLAPEMLAFARMRAERAGLAVEFAVANAEEWQPPAEPFDAAVSRWGLMLMLRPELALANVRAALRPSGYFAAAVWGSEERSPFLALARAVMQRELGEPAGDPTAPGPFRFRDAKDLMALFSSAGFQDVRTESVSVSPSFDDGKHYTRYMRAMSSALDKALTAYRPEQVAGYWRALEAAVDERRDDNGRVRLDSEVHCVIGTA